MKIVVFSDAHGDATTAGLDRFEDVAGACADVLEAASREKVDLALFLGDLTDPDTSRSHRAVGMLAAFALACKGAGIDFRAIVGNHDVVEDGTGTSTLSPLAAAGFAVSSKPEIVPLSSGGIGAVVALPYPPRSATFDSEAFVRDRGVSLVSSMRREEKGLEGPLLPVVVAGHLMIRGADPGSESADLARGRDVFYPWEACREIFGRDALLLNGHYHRRQVAAGGIQIPGSLARLRFDEEHHEPGFLVCEHKGGRGPWNVRFERVKARRLVTIGPDIPAWNERRAPADRGFPGRDGAIVRILPGPDATDDLIGSMKRDLEHAGAAAVRVEPRAPGTKTVAPGRAAPGPRRAPRAVVMEMADEARTRDRDALKSVLDRELTTQKL